MELSSILHDTYEILRLKEDRNKMQWEDERTKYINHIKLLYKKNEKYKQILKSTLIDFRLLKKKVYDDKGIHDTTKRYKDKDLNSLNEIKKRKIIDNKDISNKSSKEGFDLKNIENNNLIIYNLNIIKDDNTNKTHENLNPKIEETNSSQTTCISDSGNHNLDKDTNVIDVNKKTDNNIRMSNKTIKINKDFQSTNYSTIKINKDFQSTNYSIDQNNMFNKNSKSVHYFNNDQINNKNFNDVTNKSNTHVPNKIKYIQNENICAANKIINNDTTTNIINTSNNIALVNKNNKSNKEIKRIESVRTKSERAVLPGHACEECLKFYQAMQQQGVLNNNNNLNNNHLNNNNNDIDQMKQLLQKCSRHKSKWTPPHTPDGYWDLSLDTPEKWK